MSIENDLLELEEIVAELIDVGETLADLSLIRFELVNDTHWDSLDMTLFIFGAGDPETECPVFETRVDTEVLLTESQGLRGISCQRLAALFAGDLINEITRRSIPVVCNERDETEAHINLAEPGDKILLPMIR
jgi:hypothetical protein